jgi:hypothetical protein
VIIDMTDRVISIVSLTLAAFTSLFAGYIAFAGLRFTARPKIRVELLNPKDGAKRLVFPPESHQILRFKFTNVGQWYAHPPARRIHMFISFTKGCKPTAVHYGSTQETPNTDVKTGKGARPYLEVEGMSSFYKEEAEEFHVDIVMPIESGTFDCEVAATYGDGLDLGTEWFQFDVEGPTKA